MNIANWTPEERTLLEIALSTDDPKERDEALKSLEKYFPEEESEFQEVDAMDEDALKAEIRRLLGRDPS